MHLSIRQFLHNRTRAHPQLVTLLLCTVALTACTAAYKEKPTIPITTDIAAELSITATAAQSTETETISTPTPNIPPVTDIEAAQILFAKQSLSLGELETTFRAHLAEGNYSDYKRQDMDVNGDGQAEILLSGNISQWHLYFGILGYSDQRWQPWLYTATDTKYCADTRTTVTAEQLTVDFLTCSGGTGVFEVTWEQRWVRCGPQSCAVVWSAPLFHTERVVVQQAVRTYTSATIERPDPATIRLTTQRWGNTLYAFPNGTSAQPGTAQRTLGPNTVETYRWDGQRYLWQSREEQTPGMTVRDEFDLITQESYNLAWQVLTQPFAQADGQLQEGWVQVVADFWQLPADGVSSGWAVPAAAAHTGTPQTLGEWVAGLATTAEPFACRLSVYHHTEEQVALLARRDVPCTHNFSHLVWLDITGDGQAELLLHTIPPAGETDVDAETSAGMQRLHLYGVGETLAELAVVDGYVNGLDGAGIRWRTGDKAGTAPEIWAGLPLAPLQGTGAPWPDHTRRFQIYRWDGPQQKLVTAEVREGAGK